VEAYESYSYHVVYQRVSQFAAVQLSAIYHDVVKDRLYTDAANSPRRRSTQTALHHLVTGLCQLLSPILAFTADEAWEFIPGHQGGIVHLSDWSVEPFPRAEQERQFWDWLLATRERVLPELEKARQARLIGKALEAQVNLTVPNLPDGPLAPVLEALRELLNVSQLSIVRGQGSDVVTEVKPAAGKKCERCWHWELDVGQSAAHPTLCGRCVRVVDARQSAG
jgi:isoleucyl-tRNA synthetase